MIDNPGLTADLLGRLEAALPLPAVVTPYLAGALCKLARETAVPGQCRVVWLSNAGDEGGIMCKLAFDGEDDAQAAFITSAIPSPATSQRIRNAG
jgi:hypothetical protein